jgi:hypothetical protein
MEAPSDITPNFGQEHFGQAYLGHKARTKRLVHTANCLLSSPEGTLAEKLKDPADLMGFYRLLQRPEVTHAAVLEPHQQRTRQLMAQSEQPVLIVHDDTDLDYTGHSGLDDLGPIGDGGGRGYLCHNSLAITPDRQVLGLASQILHTIRRVPPGETPKQRRDHPQRKSRLWKAAAEAIGLAPAHHRWVHVADRGADCFEFLDWCVAEGQGCVIRCAQDRLLEGLEHVGLDRICLKLKDYARQLPALDTRALAVAASGQRAARQTTVAVSSAPVTLAVPHFARGECRGEPLELWVVRVWEIAAPAGVEPLEWILLTTVAASRVAQAWEIVDWYGCRPVIEEFHKGLKTGAGVEKLQFEFTDRLEPAIGLLSAVTAVLLDLRSWARHPRADAIPATAVVPLLYVLVLSGWRYKQPRPQMSVREFVLALGRLGGHLNRKGDGLPGWLTLWRGWANLQLMVAGAEAINPKGSV